MQNSSLPCVNVGFLELLCSPTSVTNDLYGARGGSLTRTAWSRGTDVTGSGAPPPPAKEIWKVQEENAFMSS